MTPISVPVERAKQLAKDCKILEVVYTWDDGREEVRYRRPFPSTEAWKFIGQVRTLRERAINGRYKSPYSWRIITVGGSLLNMTPISVPIERAKQLAKDIGAEAVVIIAFRGDSYATTSYGKDRETCQSFEKVADHIHDDIANGVIDIPDVLTRDER